MLNMFTFDLIKRNRCVEQRSVTNNFNNQWRGDVFCDGRKKICYVLILNVWWLD